MREYLLGFDIGGTKCAVVLASVRNGIRILDKIKFPTEAGKGFQQVKERLFQSGRALLERNHTGRAELLGIGISCGGPLDSERGVVLSPPNLPGWDEIPLTDLAEKEFGVPAYLQNDANACALVEWKLGAGRGTRNMIFLTMGTGFGGGVICEGQLVKGACDMAGEVGHLLLEKGGPVGFGKAGSVEGFCGGGGIARQARAYTKEKVSQGKTPQWIADGVAEEEIDAKLMAEYAQRGDKDALAIYDRVGKMLGYTLSLLMDAFNPERIVIGSIFARSGQLLRPSMERVIEEQAIPQTRRACQVVPAQTGERLGDLASIAAACYGMGLEIEEEGEPVEQRVLFHLERMTKRYPVLEEKREDILQAYRMLSGCYQRGGKLLLCGNGGSAADAGHIVGELMKGFYKKRPLPPELKDRLGEMGDRLQGALPAVSLAQADPLFTAFSNDVDASLVFAQQVIGLGRKGDVLMAISTSGNSDNIVKAAKAARAVEMRVIGLTGEGGGRLAEESDVLINVPAAETADVQELHLPVYHALCAMLEEKFFK